MVQVEVVSADKLTLPWAAGVSDDGQRVLLLNERASMAEALDGYEVVRRYRPEL